jgi:hypothetical protein
VWWPLCSNGEGRLRCLNGNEIQDAGRQDCFHHHGGESWEVSEVRLADFKTMVHPAATAGAILRVAMASGKFHGVVSRQGPTGFLVTSSGTYRPGNVCSSPH